MKSQPHRSDVDAFGVRVDAEAPTEVAAATMAPACEALPLPP